MKRNTALFGASLVAGVVAASGLIATSAASSAAAGSTFYGAAWSDPTSGGSHGWSSGSYADPYGVEFSGSAAATAVGASGTFKLAAPGATTVTVTTTCVSGKPQVLVAGGGATGVHAGGSVPLATFTGAPNAKGTVYFASTNVSGHVAGVYISLPSYAPGTWVALTGANCAAATTPPPTTSTSTSTTVPPTSSTTAPPTATSTSVPPTSTGTGSSSTSPTSAPSSSTTMPPATTEPPTPTPTTTTLPVTG